MPYGSFSFEERYMAHYSVRSKQEIKAVIDFVVSSERKITIEVEGDKTPYSSRIVVANYAKEVSGGEKAELIVERLDPDRGNTLIEKHPRAVVRFLLRDKACEFDTEYIGLSESQFFRPILSYPDSIRITERRVHERDTTDMPEFVSARFTLGRGEKTYELEVVDYSANGVGLLVTEKDLELLEKIEAGDKLQNLVLYAKWTTAMVVGTVVHKTKVKNGETYIIGVRLEEILETMKAS
jgi:hypothetical protein